jgi:hypothetical protein
MSGGRSVMFLVLPGARQAGIAMKTSWRAWGASFLLAALCMATAGCGQGVSAGSFVPYYARINRATSVDRERAAAAVDAVVKTHGFVPVPREKLRPDEILYATQETEQLALSAQYSDGYIEVQVVPMARKLDDDAEKKAILADLDRALIGAFGDRLVK